jgi:capsular polysaccharide biosynthesis protein
MFFKGKGYRNMLNRKFVRLVKTIFPFGYIYNSPRHFKDFQKWIPKNQSQGGLIMLKNGEKRKELPPEIVNYSITKRFSKYFYRLIPPAYLLKLNKGIVLGNQTNLIISADGTLSADLSREFGAYGGKPAHEFSIFSDKLNMPELNLLVGKTAVVSTQGCRNFHHWLYDSLPRIYLVMEAGLFDEMDYFLISSNNQNFQKESLRLLKIPEGKIINPLEGKCNFSAEELYVPSLPSPLGSVSPWVITFLRNLFNPNNEKIAGYERIFISRKNVKTRHIVNHDEFLICMSTFSIKVVYPEDFSVSSFARIIAGSKFIISIHGSGLSNICFMSPGTTVVDILAPYHQDAYYWQISNLCDSSYIGFFAEGSHPEDDVDLVKLKIDDDLIINISSLTEILNKKL